MARMHSGTKTAAKSAKSMAKTFVPAGGVTIIPKTLPQQIAAQSFRNIARTSSKFGNPAQKELNRAMMNRLPEGPHASGRFLSKVEKEGDRLLRKHMAQMNNPFAGKGVTNKFRPSSLKFPKKK